MEQDNEPEDYKPLQNSLDQDEATDLMNALEAAFKPYDTSSQDQARILIFTAASVSETPADFRDAFIDVCDFLRAHLPPPPPASELN